MVRYILSLLMMIIVQHSLIQYVEAQDNDKTVTYEINAPHEIALGQNVEVVVNLQVKDGWYIYAPTSENESKGLIVSKVDLIVPKGMSLGQLQISEPFESVFGQVFKGDKVSMKQSIISSNDLPPGTYKIKGTITYQACNKEYCEPPQSIPISLKVKVVETN